ncbi:MAG TPA: PGPGW domain-containing protein, partial [Microlunatus sp.]|nr:PGPGW domain-containing protein [Microlunatus sp.]
RHHHHVLIEPAEDRWAWRRRIRQNPHQLRIYRVGVGVLGLLLICLGIVTGPLPGPGGIPLVLLGLAIWSSEFEWAYRLRQRFKAEAHKFRGWSARKKVAFWVAFFAVCATFGYSYLLVLGTPFWVPDVGASLLDHLPGVEAPG